MLAVAATDSLCLADPAALKRAPSSLSACFSFTAPPSAACWASDNAYMYFVSGHKLQKYDPATNSIHVIYETTDETPICELLVKDKGTLVTACEAKVLVIDGIQATPRIAQTLDSHKGPVEHLALSNDTSLLASTAVNTVHIHNLTLGSQTSLRGLTAYHGQHISACVFHPYARTRLLLAIGKSLIIYDITKPSTPMKTITLSDAAGGDICAISCSPFSKTLVSVATAGGTVGLVDLDKEKGLFRVLNVKVPLTSIAFSPEGAAIYLGTENGKLLLLDLRALDKPPKTVVISESGCRVEALCVQKKLKVQSDVKSATTARSAASSVETKRAVAAKAAGPAKASPSRLRPSTRTASGAITTPGRKVVTTKAATPPVKPADSKKVFSPVRDPLGNSTKDSDNISIDLETLTGARKDVKSVTPSKGSARPVRTSISSPRSPLVRSPPARSPPKSTFDRPASAASSRLRATTATSPKSATADAAARRARVVSSSRASVDATRPRRTSTASVAESISTAGRQGPSAKPRERTLSSASSRPRERPAAKSTRPSNVTSRPPSSLSQAYRAQSRTPSPELPDMGMDPRAAIVDLGLGSPNWAAPLDEEIDKGKGKAVGFKDDSDEEEEIEEISLEHKRLAAAAERERNFSMQVSPARRATSGLAHSPWQPSPLRRSMGPQPAPMPMPTSPGSSATAQDFLRNIVRDVMFDYQMETRQEMMGLHLDLVRMGRSWKTELRDLMDEYVGDLRDLRDENKRLREENEQLRRGY
ncbi:WD40-repeat-containing domain protein [Schizophyllum amplum]|uniref:WD40-repeat-containing domain protein n=1 Tax=Schizophyllum amplum TaxID=97359 RepID=A0A550C196_9AGAR|nr:WD40-repeat-containing domain protein [Auriculariopsis ampla]